MGVSDEIKSISKYYKSFSGSDTLAFIIMPGSNPVVLGSLTTVSYSIYRNKKPVINIGRTNINGVTRGSRIFAGTMVFTLINQHWIEDLKEQHDWLQNITELKSDELPLFDIMIVSANEYGNYVSMYIYGIDITDEAQTISVQDLFTENIFSFVARDVSVFKAGQVFNKSSSNSSNSYTRSNNKQRLYILDDTKDYTSEQDREQAAVKWRHDYPEDKPFGYISRDLYYSTSRPMIGKDVSDMQDALNRTRIVGPLDITGIFDKDMDTAVRQFQSAIKVDIDGVINQRLYELLMSGEWYSDRYKNGIVINRSGSRVYREAKITSNIMDFVPFNEYVSIEDVVNAIDGSTQRFYKTSSGYITFEDIYSHYYVTDNIFLPILKPNDKSPYVTMFQSALKDIYKGEVIEVSGCYDSATIGLIKRFQRENGLSVIGDVDAETWSVIQSQTKKSIVIKDGFALEFDTMPGSYTLDMHEANSKDIFIFHASSELSVSVKASVICYFKDKSKTYQKTFFVDKDAPIAISIKDIGAVFQYDPTYGMIPTMIEYIVYPYEKTPYKWTIRMRGV